MRGRDIAICRVYICGAEMLSGVIPSRASKEGPEDDFLRRSFDRGLNEHVGMESFWFYELDMPIGVPDAVAVVARNNNAVKTNRKNLNAKHIRTLCHIYKYEAESRTGLQESLFLSRTDALRILSDLSDADLIELEEDTIRRFHIDDVFRLEQIIAIEAKLTNWREAVLQASRNKWFASHSYVLVPPIGKLEQLVLMAQDHGVGVITFDGDSVELVLDCGVQDIPASYGSWLVNEWFVCQCKKSRKSSRTFR